MSKPRNDWFLQMVENPTIIVLLVGVAFGYVTLSSDVERNAEEIKRLQSEIASELSDMNTSLVDQSARFELYLDSVRNVRTASDEGDDTIQDQIDDLEDRIILLEVTKS